MPTYAHELPTIIVRLDSRETKDKINVYAARRGWTLQALMLKLLEPVVKEAQDEKLIREAE